MFDSGRAHRIDIDINAQMQVGKSTILALAPAHKRHRLDTLQLVPVTFTVNNAGGRSKITNVYGDHITTSTTNINCACARWDRRERCRRRAEKAGNAEEEDLEGLALEQHRT